GLYAGLCWLARQQRDRVYGRAPHRQGEDRAVLPKIEENHPEDTGRRDYQRRGHPHFADRPFHAHKHALRRGRRAYMELCHRHGAGAPARQGDDGHVRQHPDRRAAQPADGANHAGVFPPHRMAAGGIDLQQAGAELAGGPPKGLAMSVRLLCFNIHGGYDMWGRRDLVRLRRMMERHRVDIGVFQEIETRPSRGGTEKDIRTIAGPERPHHLPGLAMTEAEGWYGNLIVSRYPIRRGLVHSLETSPSFEPRNAVDALIELPTGLLRVIGTHLSLSARERWSEVRNLIRLIDDVEETEKNPMLLMGDINEWRPR